MEDLGHRHNPVALGRYIRLVVLGLQITILRMNKANHLEVKVFRLLDKSFDLGWMLGHHHILRNNNLHLRNNTLSN
jgi:hypothetical protein